MKSLLAAALLVAKKDLSIEWKSRELVLSTLLFSSLVILLSSLSFHYSRSLAQIIAPGVLWLAIVFSGIVSVAQSWQRERTWDGFEALLLSPIPDASIFLGKTLSGLIFISFVELFALPLAVLLFDLSVSSILGPLLLVMVLGSLGFIAPATLFGAMRGGSELRLTIVVFPLVSPALLAAVVATRDLFAGAQLPEIQVWVNVLLVFDALMLFMGATLFPLVVRE